MAENKISLGASANLDFLRSVAVLAVLLTHIAREFYFERSFGIGEMGRFGVLLFFVHTSLVLMYSLQRTRQSTGDLLKNFYIRRFFRIYPLSIVAVLAAVALHLHASERGMAFVVRPGALELVSNLLLVQNLTYSASIVGPLWSLPIEVQMYMVLPFLFLWRKRSLWTLLSFWVAFGLLGHLPLAVPALGWMSLVLYFPNFLPGVMAFTLPKKSIFPGYLWPPFVLGLVLLYSQFPSRRFGAELCLLLGLAIPLFREITFRPLVRMSGWIATYSYGIYLAQSFCIWFALGRHHSWTLFVVTMVAVPVILYHAVERPAIKLGLRVANAANRERLVAVPAAAGG